MNDRDLSSAVIDFSKCRNQKGEINEGWWLTFGAILRWIMPSLYKGSVFPLKVKGSPSELSSFANVLSKERNYLESWKSNGLDDPNTYKSKSKLDRAISQFERTTALRWPFTK
jgi:hypothetical protein